MQYTICTKLFHGRHRCLHCSLDLIDNIDAHTVLAEYNHVFRQAAGIFVGCLNIFLLAIVSNVFLQTPGFSGQHYVN